MSFECVGCGGMPKGSNSPCAVCGETSQSTKIEYAMLDMKTNVEQYLPVCCEELIEWSNTSVLRSGGVVRLLADRLTSAQIGHFGMCLNIVKAEVGDQAMRRVVEATSG